MENQIKEILLEHRKKVLGVNKTKIGAIVTAILIPIFMVLCVIFLVVLDGGNVSEHLTFMILGGICSCLSMVMMIAAVFLWFISKRERVNFDPIFKNNGDLILKVYQSYFEENGSSLKVVSFRKYNGQRGGVVSEFRIIRGNEEYLFSTELIKESKIDGKQVAENIVGGVLTVASAFLGSATVMVSNGSQNAYLVNFELIKLNKKGESISGNLLTAMVSNSSNKISTDFVTSSKDFNDNFAIKIHDEKLKTLYSDDLISNVLKIGNNAYRNSEVDIFDNGITVSKVFRNLDQTTTLPLAIFDLNGRKLTWMISNISKKIKYDIQMMDKLSELMSPFVI